MKKLAVLFVLLISSAAFAAQKTAPPPGPQRPLSLPKISEKKLPNGMLVIVAPLHNVPKISTVLSIHSGRAVWRDKHPGVSGLAGSVMREGTATRTGKQIQEELRSMGASIGTNVNDDATTITGDSLSEFTDRYLALLSDIVQNPAFPAEEVELAKQNTIQSIQAQRADPNFLGNERLRKEVFGKHPYSFLVPEESAIKAITRETLQSFAKQFYAPNNTHLIIVGDVEPAQAFAMAEKAFGSWKSVNLPEEKVSAALKRDKRQIYFVHRPGSIQSSIVLGLATFPRNNPDYFSTRTADTIFGSSFNSRLTQNIREKRGYTYSPFSINFTMAQSGLFSVGAAVRNEVTGLTLLEMFYELDRMRVAPVTAEELNSAKQYQVGNFSIELASQANLANRIDTVYTYNLPKNFIETFREKVTSLTDQDVLRSAAKYFDSYRVAIVIVGDYDKVKDQVAPFGDVIVYDESGKVITKA